MRQAICLERCSSSFVMYIRKTLQTLMSPESLLRASNLGGGPPPGRPPHRFSRIRKAEVSSGGGASFPSPLPGSRLSPLLYNGCLIQTSAIHPLNASSFTKALRTSLVIQLFFFKANVSYCSPLNSASSLKTMPR